MSESSSAKKADFSFSSVVPGNEVFPSAIYQPYSRPGLHLQPGQRLPRLEPWQFFQWSQIVTSSWGGRRTLPYAFTEQGVAMLSSVLNSERAILVNIHIVRIFTKLREVLLTHKDILLMLEKLERRAMQHDGDIKLIFKYLKALLNPPTEPMRKIGFKHKQED